ncbi:MAG: periplasmic heavy metal sensor [Bacteroidia bacterium]|nr:periplasmic heavy metal sensor [Bacteroidia bacterium]
MCITLVLIMVSLTVFSQPGQKDRPSRQSKEAQMQQQQPPEPPMPGENCGPDQHFPPKLDLPDLSEDQEKQLKEMGIKHLQTLIPLKALEREKEAHLAALLTANDSDPKHISEATDLLGKVRNDILKQVVDHDQAIRKILTPEQKVVFDMKPKPFLEPK